MRGCWLFFGRSYALKTHLFQWINCIRFTVFATDFFWRDKMKTAPLSLFHRTQTKNSNILILEWNEIKLCLSRRWLSNKPRAVLGGGGSGDSTATNKNSAWLILFCSSAILTSSSSSSFFRLLRFAFSRF